MRPSASKPRPIRTVSIALLATALLSTTASAQSSGLHNNTKSFAAPADVTWKHWDDPLELDRTWRAAIVRVPTGPGRSRQVTIEELEKLAPPSDRKLPTVIYLHGCSGVWSGTHQRTKFLADNGFLVIAPVSLAREVYPRSCNVDTREAGLFRGTIVLRRNDAGHAVERARDLPIVDGGNIVLMGFSEGALTTVTFAPENTQQRVRARVAEGWTCHAGWPEYHGVNAPAGEPVLTLVGERDPWYLDPWTKGDCSQFLDPRNGSKSVVYRQGSLATKHGLLEFEEARQDVLNFLKNNLNF